MKDVPIILPRSERDRIERTVLEDPLLHTLSNYKDANTRRHGTDKRKQSIGGKNRASDANLVTKASMDVPMKWDGKSLVAENNIRSQIVCNIPASVNNGRWSAIVRGSSIVHGPMGCATGAMNLVYHPSIAKGSEIHGGVQVGDQAGLSVGGLIRGDRSSLGVTTTMSTRRTSSIVTTLTTQHKFQSFQISSRVSLGRPSRSWNVSVSPAFKKHKAQFGFGWSRKQQPQLSMMLSPKISPHRRGTFNMHWRPSGGWNVGATLTQSLASKLASLGIGVQLASKTKGLEWIFTWHRGDVTLRIPISITQYSTTVMNCLQVAYVSFLSQVIQDAIADLWNLNVSPDESEALRKEQQRFKRDKVRSDAERQKKLMLRQARSRAKAEQAKKGLVIRRALYQVKGGDSWDVTTQLQFWTENSSLILPPSSKKDLLGFYNVAGEANGKSLVDESSSWLQDFWGQPDSEAMPNTPTPILSIEYYFADRLYKIAILDEEELELPSSKAVPAPAE